MTTTTTTTTAMAVAAWANAHASTNASTSSSSTRRYLFVFLVGISIGCQLQTYWLYGGNNNNNNNNNGRAPAATVGAANSMVRKTNSNGAVAAATTAADQQEEPQEEEEDLNLLSDESSSSGGAPQEPQEQLVGSPALLGEMCQRLFATSLSSSEASSSSSPPPLAPPPSAMTVWSRHLEEIAAATYIRGVTVDVEVWADKVTNLLSLVTPRLAHSVQSVFKEERVWKQFDRLLHLALRRYDYLVVHKNNTNTSTTTTTTLPPQQPPPRPVKIVIMGGSVVGGTSCSGQRLKSAMCAWPNRLHHFLHNFFLPKHTPTATAESILDIQVITVGGIDSELGQLLLNYDLLPARAQHADVIIHAYSTNDANNAAVQRAAERNLTYEQHLLDMEESFLRTATRPKQPPHCENKNQTQTQQEPPLLLFLDDHISTGIHGILSALLYPQVLHTLSSYYGNIAVSSFADMIRDMVYGDNKECTFSPPFYVPSKQKFKYEVHPYGEAHILLAWVTAYQMLNLVTTRCDQHHQEQLLQQFQEQPHRASAVSRVDEVLANRPKPKPNVFPPRLFSPPGQDDLTMETITDLWKKEEQKSLSQTCPSSSSSSEQQQQQQQSMQRCPLAWMSMLTGGRNGHGMTSFFQQHHVTLVSAGAPEGGGAWYWGENVCRETGRCSRIAKPGLVTSGPVGSYMELTFPVQALFGASSSSSQPPLTKVAILYMKSYGLTWENSTALLSVVEMEHGQVLGSTLVESYFKENDETKASVIVPTEISFVHHPVPPGVALQLRANLTSGNSFKIMGLAVCHW